MKHGDPRLPAAVSVVMTVDPGSGAVTERRAWRQSTGSPILDNAATSRIPPMAFQTGNGLQGSNSDHLHLSGASY